MRKKIIIVEKFDWGCLFVYPFSAFICFIMGFVIMICSVIPVFNSLIASEIVEADDIRDKYRRLFKTVKYELKGIGKNKYELKKVKGVE